MSYKYSTARYPPNKTVLQDIDLAANRLKDKLMSNNYYDLKIGKQIKKYFNDKINSIDTNLVKYAYHLSWSLYDTDKKFDDFVLIDHGGGTGIFGMLAKELGIGTVIYNDINEEWTNDAKKIAESVNLESDYYISGDIDVLVSFIKSKDIYCDAIISYNVIEHIYNIEYFFSKLQYINFSKRLLIFMSTGANEYNPIIKRKTVHDQIKAEIGVNKKGEVFKAKSYFKIRKEIITKISSNLKENEISELAIRTRGMNSFDIKKQIEKYLNDGNLPKLPSHPTNTCNPYSGYWAEHFMNPYFLVELLNKKNYNAKILTGYYGKSNNRINFVIGKFLNILLYFLKTKGLFIAPYWTIYAKI